MYLVAGAVALTGLVAVLSIVDAKGTAVLDVTRNISEFEGYRARYTLEGTSHFASFTWSEDAEAVTVCVSFGSDSKESGREEGPCIRTRRDASGRVVVAQTEASVGGTVIQFSLKPSDPHG